MLSYTAYKLLHIAGVLLLFSAIGGIALHAANGGTKQSNAARGLIAALQGVSLLLILVTGFGALARLGAGFPAWAWAKIVVWLVIGAVAMLPYRRPNLAKPFLILMPLMGVIAAFLTLYKPF